MKKHQKETKEGGVQGDTPIKTIFRAIRTSSEGDNLNSSVNEQESGKRKSGGKEATERNKLNK